MTISKVILLVFSLIAVCFIVNIQNVNAEQAVGFGVTNNIFDLEIPAGSTYKGSFSIFNEPESAPTPIHIELSLWDLEENSDDIEFVTSEPALNATKWFYIEGGRDFILDPEEDKEIQFGIAIPEEVSPGSYLVMMRFQAVLPDFYFESEGPRFLPEIGTLIFIKVPLLSLDRGRSLYSAEIEFLEPEGDSIPLIDKMLPHAEAGVFDNAVRELVARVKNDGVYHFKMSGTIEIKNIFGRTVEKANLPGRYLLPKRSRNIDIAVLPPPQIERLPFLSRLLREIGYSLKTNTYFGPYSATMTLIIPEGLPIVETVNFWVVPWKFLLVILLLVGGATVFILRFGDRFKPALNALLGRIRIPSGLTKGRKKVIHSRSRYRKMCYNTIVKIKNLRKKRR
jgi:hypothetical protein